ncbi:hypothetical protein CEE36_10100 [candidate division TA06 bacterium B3_TA06]|uniref:Uncharacterized protein n=1 Tax=candidate division TA06 bacterium B3_TA06 TaxID=2012487 RepID=A0A532UY43_UNCT6|nr:MAG: hypothetical protein CEE36_10100 [candidate division TA06 bacterium B3_TA06]
MPKPWLEAYAREEDREKANGVVPQPMTFTIGKPEWSVKIDEVAHNPQVVIDFKSFFKGFKAEIYYKQRLVDTLTSATPSGQITWGDGKKHAEYEIKVNVNGVWQSKRIERFSARAPSWKFDYEGDESAPGISIEYKYWEPGKLGCPVTIEGPRGITHSFNDHRSSGKYWYTLKNKPHGLYLIKVDTDYPRNKVRHIRPIRHSPNSPDHQ